MPEKESHVDRKRKTMDYTRLGLPNYEELPDIPLYIDQVIQYINSILQPVMGSGAGDALTRSMINNYVKAGLIPPPEGKLYTRSHVAYLLIVAAMKNVFSIPEIDQLFQIQRSTYNEAVAYDYFVTELDNALTLSFLEPGASLPEHATKETAQTMLVRAMALSFAGKAYVRAQLPEDEKH